MELETATIEGLYRYNMSELNWARVRNYNHQICMYNSVWSHISCSILLSVCQFMTIHILGTKILTDL